MPHLFYTTAKTFSLLVPVFILQTLFCHAGQFTWTGAVSSLKQRTGLTEKALRNFDLWAGKKRIGANKLKKQSKLNPLQSQYLNVKAQLTYCLRVGGKILAFSVKP